MPTSCAARSTFWPTDSISGFPGGVAEKPLYALLGEWPFAAYPRPFRLRVQMTETSLEHACANADLRSQRLLTVVSPPEFGVQIRPCCPFEAATHWPNSSRWSEYPHTPEQESQGNGQGQQGGSQQPTQATELAFHGKSFIRSRQSSQTPAPLGAAWRCGSQPRRAAGSPGTCRTP